MTPFAAVKMIDLRYMASQKYPLPNFLQSRDILLADWVNFTQVQTPATTEKCPTE
jgi:hypothetical protein